MTIWAVVFRPDGTSDVCENPPVDALVSPRVANQMVRDGECAYVSVMDAGTVEALFRGEREVDSLSLFDIDNNDEVQP